MREEKSFISCSCIWPDVAGLPGGIVEGDEPAAGDADEIKFVQFQVGRERIEIAGDGAGLLARRRVWNAAAPPASVEGDDAVPCGAQSGHLAVPIVDRARVGVEQDHRPALPASVDVTQLDAGQVRPERRKAFSGFCLTYREHGQ
jgi:hypothetical protein